MKTSIWSPVLSIFPRPQNEWLISDVHPEFLSRGVEVQQLQWAQFNFCRGSLQVQVSSQQGPCFGSISWPLCPMVKKRVISRSSLMVQMVKRLHTMKKTWVQSLGRQDLLEKEMATDSSILAWKTPWTVEPVKLQSMGSQRVGHDWATSLSLSRSSKDFIDRPLCVLLLD